MRPSLASKVQSRHHTFLLRLPLCGAHRCTRVQLIQVRDLRAHLSALSNMYCGYHSGNKVTLFQVDGYHPFPFSIYGSPLARHHTAILRKDIIVLINQ